MKKINILILLIIIVLSIYFLTFKKYKMYEQNLFYMDTYINIKIFAKDKEQVEIALKRANEIYKTYHELSNRYEAYHGLNNVYYINNTSEDKVKIDPKLYDLISYGKSWYEKSNGIKNINIGNVIDIWKEHQEKNLGVPSKGLLKEANIDINNVVLLENNYIKTNNGINLDLGSIAKGYATEEVGQYLKSIGLNKFLINAGGNVLVGEHYNQDKYKIGLQNPLDGVGIYQVLKGENIAVVTSGGYERYYEFEGKKYNHIINPNTLYPENKYKSVSVITNDSKKADGISLVLFILDIDQGKEFLKQFDDVEAIWFIDENKIFKTDGLAQYE